MTGLGVRFNVGGFPAFVATPVACPGGSAQVSSGVATNTGGFLTVVNLSVAMTNAAGIATDCQFFAMLHSGEPNAPDSPVPPLDTDRAPACTTIGDETICVVGE